MKEPGIKLFGRKIALPDKDGAVAGGVGWLGASGGGGETRDEEQLHDQEDQIIEECDTTMQEMNQNLGATKEPTSSDFTEDPRTPKTGEDAFLDNANPKSGNERKPSQKRPDKIVPCPRCNSMDTKFCYYNNYNINQPRHFCKSCQRYWTAGGTMRNVPVGAGRRKTKNPASNCHNISIAEALEAATTRVDMPNGLHRLAYGPDDNVMPNLNSVTCLIPCIPGVAWPIPWNPNHVMHVPAICPPGYPVPVYPATYWNYGTPNPWNVPWVPTPSPTATNLNGNVSDLNSPLGKHSRNGELLKPSNSLGAKLSKPILVPNKLRIDDHEDAAKSSIRETLGIKYDSISREVLFKALQPKGGDKKLSTSPSPVLRANPAAMSRSTSFNENT